jgi:GNAT superfamily N-acetyltransferase
MNKILEETRNGFLISTDKTKLDIAYIHHFLAAESYWAENIPLKTVRRSIRNALCFGIYHHQKQIGFARVITDKATFAYLGDVFIQKEFRGRGLSKWMMATIHRHPELQQLRRWWLGTRDAHGLYEQFGWTRITSDMAQRFMQKVTPDVYKNNPEVL